MEIEYKYLDGCNEKKNYEMNSIESINDGIRVLLILF